MQINGPVTQTEFRLPAGAALMSTTDLKGVITYANDAFVDASGFERAALEGQPHDLLRHPDMPPQVFADLWATLQAGEAWTGLVRNRRRNGDHYWLRLNAVPVLREGERVGYMSVGSAPTSEEIAAAERHHQQLWGGHADLYRLHKGLLLRRGWRGWASGLRTLPVRWRIRLALAAPLPVAAGALWAAGPAPLPAALAGGAIALALALACRALEAQLARPLEQLRAQALTLASGEPPRPPRQERLDEIGMSRRALDQLGHMFHWLLDDVGRQVAAVRQAAAELPQPAAAAQGRAAAPASAGPQPARVPQAGPAPQEDGTGLSGGVDVPGGQALPEARRIRDLLDSLAQQAGALAVCTAAEAARAGEAGRGFAVLADEVQALARHSAEAARELQAVMGARAPGLPARTALAPGA